MSNTARNDITGNWLKSKAPNDNYRNGFDAIFGKKEVQELPEQLTPHVPPENDGPIDYELASEAMAAKLEQAKAQNK
jgi:hypothetical protein